MTKPKKRPSKAAKAAKKIVAESKMLQTNKEVQDAKSSQEFRPADAAPKTSAAIKPRPDKKRG